MKRKIRTFLSAIGNCIGNWLEQAPPLGGIASFAQRDEVTDWRQPDLEAELRVMASRNAERDTKLDQIKEY